MKLIEYSLKRFGWPEEFSWHWIDILKDVNVLLSVNYFILFYSFDGGLLDFFFIHNVLKSSYEKLIKFDSSVYS